VLRKPENESVKKILRAKMKLRACESFESCRAIFESDAHPKHRFSGCIRTGIAEAIPA